MNRTACSRLLPLLASLAWTGGACGPAPVPIERTGGGQAGSMGSMGMGGADAATLPPGHPPIDGGQGAGSLAGTAMGMPPGGMEALRFAGVVRLSGALAASDEGFVFVSVRPAGGGMPLFSRKYAVADASLEESGDRLLAFELDEAHTMGGVAPGVLELEARFDPDGFVDSREGIVTVRVPVEPGATDVEVVLGP